MAPEIYYPIRIVHLVSMAVWFAVPLMITGDLKRSLALGKAHAEAAISRVERTLAISTFGALATIVSGLVMIFALGGFGAISPRIHAGFGLALVLLAVEFFLLKGAVSRAGGSVAAGKPEDAQPQVARVAMFGGISHLLKLVILVLMVWKT